MPKQFVPLIGEQSTFQQTLQRVADRSLFARPVVATNEACRFLVECQARDVVPKVLPFLGTFLSPAVVALEEGDAQLFGPRHDVR